MKDKKGNTIHVGDRIKVLWGPDNREYEGRVVTVRKNITLVSAQDYIVNVNNPDRLLKIQM